MSEDLVEEGTIIEEIEENIGTNWDIEENVGQEDTNNNNVGQKETNVVIEENVGQGMNVEVKGINKGLNCNQQEDELVNCNR